ncbi:auxin response factor 17 [Ricinus communis]|uniref:auxin response factor 17 n=1 Tax=Ricinus communis TaxID=3988 RepID=UPI00201AF0F6|nr:auxin response factor 17 [Ricinus communis]XP_015571564.2 auxin response factor 17 [Ricinus communis]
MPPSLHPSADLRRVDRRIWRACAGSSVQIPTINSRVYYFPQGHLEQSSNSSSIVSSCILSSIALSKPVIPCQISAVQFLADPVTDEVYTKLLLFPIDSFNPSVPVLEHSGNLEQHHGYDYDDDEDKIVAFAKILTPSDANNGGGFSVPRFCADSIFPPLNYHAEPPVQTLTVTDIHGITWDFRHIYRGTPRRHLLTTGWSKFVNHKKLIAGDSVVFMRNMTGKMFIGVRRAVRPNNGGSDCARWREQIACFGGGGGDVKMKVKEEGYSRNGRGKVSPEAVMEAVERAAQGFSFEVVYYPRAGWYSDFVVRTDVVDGALAVCWSAGMRVKMAMETEDSSRMTWFQGTIASASLPDCGLWRGSPWRMLQVAWDEPEVLQNAKRVSPWQVEYVSPSPPLHGAFPPAKKFRFPENSGFLTDGEGELFFPMSGLTNSTMGNINQSLNYHSFPAGMQGARQNPFSVYGLSNFFSEDTSHLCSNNVFGNKMVPKLKTVSTELNIGSSPSENLSPDSQSSIHSCDTELVGNPGCNSTKAGISSFQLFGKIIHMSQPVESGFEDAGYVEDYVSKRYNEDNPLDLALTSSYTELLSRIDVQCQRASAVEACSL